MDTTCHNAMVRQHHGRLLVPAFPLLSPSPSLLSPPSSNPSVQKRLYSMHNHARCVVAPTRSSSSPPSSLSLSACSSDPGLQHALSSTPVPIPIPTTTASHDATMTKWHGASVPVPHPFPSLTLTLVPHPDTTTTTETRQRRRDNDNTITTFLSLSLCAYAGHAVCSPSSHCPPQGSCPPSLLLTVAGNVTHGKNPEHPTTLHDRTTTATPSMLARLPGEEDDWAAYYINM
jgi:hypothetical protein